MTSYLSTAASYLPSIPFLSSKSPDPSLTPSTSPTADLNPQNLSTIFSPETCSKKGLHWVGGEQGKGHEIYYELHGTGPEHVMFIMGLNNSSFSWNRQVDTFGAHPDYSILVFDNRGAGHSGAPNGPYSTSGMAQDALSLLDFVGWTKEREVHLVGISMGGMISLELASHSPQRLASLTLAVTSSGHGVYKNLPPSKGLATLTKLFGIKAPKDRIMLAIEMLFPATFLDEIDPNDEQARTNRETRIEEYSRRYALTRPQTLVGNLSQSIAALTHHVSPARLQLIDDNVPKITILTGDDDNLVAPANSQFLAEVMRNAENVLWDRTGHAIHSQHPQRFNDLIERVWKEGREKAGPVGKDLGKESHETGELVVGREGVELEV
ncbi:alpha/beta-hydrolase [Mrakia frigida]|uniref:alpha/beta fold hydrolase n=1 Tax=Mrakia frigida TaxID=29902 RepID=UPI003FCC06AB